MSQIVEVLLHSVNDCDTLSFRIDDEKTVDVNLNDDKCQNQLKETFIELFTLQVEDDVELSLRIDEGYKAGLYIDVCTEYIKDLNNELAGVRRMILEEFILGN